MKDGSYVFEIPRVANDMRITMNEVFDRLQKLKVCLNEPSHFFQLVWCFRGVHEFHGYHLFMFKYVSLSLSNSKTGIAFELISGFHT